MIDTDTLKRRFTAAAVFAAAGATSGCASSAEGTKAPQTSVSQFVGDDVSAQLCQSWLSGRDDRICLSRLEAAAKAVAEARNEAGCPTVVKARPTVKSPANGKGRAPTSKRPSTKTVVLLTATTEAASQDCRQATCCYVTMDTQPMYRPRPVRGRPLTDAHGQVMVAPLRRIGPAGLPLGLNIEVDTSIFTDAELAFATTHWLDAAQHEHASIGSFARAAAELEALGGPDELLTDCWIAAIDEARHAAICLAVTKATGGSQGADGFGAMPSTSPRGGGLVALATRVFQEGCIGESTAALEATRAAGGCQAPTVAAALLEIAEDESQHAALAWRTLAWAVAQGGSDVYDAVARAGHVYAASIETALAHASTQGAPRLGALCERQQWVVARDAWTGIIAPTLEALAPRT